MCQFLELGLFGNAVQHFDVDTVRETCLNFPALELLRSGFDLDICLAVLGDEVALVDGQHLVTSVQHDVCVGAVACTQEQVVLDGDRRLDLELDTKPPET